MRPNLPSRYPCSTSHSTADCFGSSGEEVMLKGCWVQAWDVCSGHISDDGEKRGRIRAQDGRLDAAFEHIYIFEYTAPCGLIHTESSSPPPTPSLPTPSHSVPSLLDFDLTSCTVVSPPPPLTWPLDAPGRSRALSTRACLAIHLVSKEDTLLPVLQRL